MRKILITFLSVLFLVACSNELPTKNMVEKELTNFMFNQTGSISTVNILEANIKSSPVNGFATADIKTYISINGKSNLFKGTVNLKRVDGKWIVVRFTSRDL